QERLRPRVLLVDPRVVVEHVLARVAARVAVERDEPPGVDAHDAVLPADGRPVAGGVEVVVVAVEGGGAVGRAQRGAEGGAGLARDEDGLRLGQRRRGGEGERGGEEAGSGAHGGRGGKSPASYGAGGRPLQSPGVDFLAPSRYRRRAPL